MKNKDEIVKRMEATGFRLYVDESTMFLCRLHGNDGRFLGDYIVAAHEDQLLIFIDNDPKRGEMKREEDGMYHECNFPLTDEQYDIIASIER